ncbi:MAG TPA: hypothetical protein VHX64_15540, partial [Caulobacteraceae bacterium]|nr:hypothetical protein [Caulobacteraceae bacterium]
MAALAKGYAALDDAALGQAFDRVAEIGDLKRVAAAGGRLLAHDTLIRPWIFLYGRALAIQGRWAEAAEAFDHPTVRNRLGNPKYVRARAIALAAVGRAQEAVQAIDEAQGCNPSPGLEGLREAVADLAALADREAELDGWPEARRLARAWIAVGLPERAAPLLARIRAALAEDDLVDWAELALQASLAEEVLETLETAQGAARETPQGRTLTAAAGVLSSRPSATIAADEPRPRFWRAIAAERRGDLVAAITDLCALADAWPLDLEVRRALARSVGKSVLQDVRPSFAPGGDGRIVNTVPFFNELDMLRLHLEEMSP